MLVLGLDTSTPATVVSVCSTAPDRELAELAGRESIDARRSGEVLVPLITEALTAAGHAAADLDAIVVGVGPGPYTSLRVGIVTAAALGDALGIPVHGVCSLDGFPLPDAARITVASDARRREVYWARYEAGRRIAGPEVSFPQEVAAQLSPGERVIGAGAQLYEAVFGAAFDPTGPRHPAAANLIRRADLTVAAQPLVPLYLRRPDAAPRTAA